MMNDDGGGVVVMMMIIVDVTDYTSSKGLAFTKAANVGLILGECMSVGVAVPFVSPTKDTHARTHTRARARERERDKIR